MNRLELNRKRYGGLPKGIYLGEEMLLTEDTSLMPQLIDVPLTTSHHVVAFVLDGEAEMLYDSERIHVQKDDFVVICQGHVTQLLELSENLCVKMFFLNPDFGEYLRQKDYFPIFIRVSRNPIISLTPTERAIMLDYFDGFEVMLKLNNTERKEIAIHMLQILFYVASQFEDFGEKEDHQRSRDQQLFESFLSLFKENFQQSHEVSFYADKLCISSNYLSKVAIRLTGKTAKRWINETLMDQACIMLRSLNGPSVKQISEFLGFGSQSAFSRCFKEYMHVSPREYRDPSLVAPRGIEPLSNV